MAIEITSSRILKPCTTPPHPLTNTLVPLTVFDLAAMDLHVATVHAYRAPMPENLEIIEGLCRVLAYFPHLAGRLTVDDSGQPCILLNNAGVRVVEARVGATLAEKMPLEGTTNTTELHPSVEDSGTNIGWCAMTLPLQVIEETIAPSAIKTIQLWWSRIGFTWPSMRKCRMAISLSQFLASWAEMVRNPSTTTVPSPYLDRSTFSIPRNPPHSDFNHLDIEFKQSSDSSDPKKPIKGPVTNFVAHFSAKFIAELKSKVPGRRSTFECLLAHLWRKITVARGLHEDEITSVRIAVNGRARMRPAVPMNFFGNMVLWAHPKAQAGDLVRLDHVHAVTVIRDAVSGTNDEYFKSFVDFGEIMKREGGHEGGHKLVGSAPESGSALCPNLEVDSWLRFNFHELDFGSGGPCAFLPPNLPVEGLMVFVPSYKETGGVDVYLALLEEHVEVFRRICYCLD
ncbi:uncharacterized protein A4U43_C07F26430 [Asparagus officinalis]|uniref:Uncharacterized protein n=1 Tax=Asparagus officinalis TaxID=4686 RepID=A0A5P1EF44_ASPOF|nr:uncharacterized protein A4U43_C07F26430 [Asparagus officinalis]